MTDKVDVWQIGCATLEMLTGLKMWFNFDDDQSDSLIEYLKAMSKSKDTQKLPKFPV